MELPRSCARRNLSTSWNIESPRNQEGVWHATETLLGKTVLATMAIAVTPNQLGSNNTMIESYIRDINHDNNLYESIVGRSGTVSTAQRLPIRTLHHRNYRWTKRGAVMEHTPLTIENPFSRPDIPIALKTYSLLSDPVMRLNVGSGSLSIFATLRPTTQRTAKGPPIHLTTLLEAYPENPSSPAFPQTSLSHVSSLNASSSEERSRNLANYKDTTHDLHLGFHDHPPTIKTAGDRLWESHLEKIRLVYGRNPTPFEGNVHQVYIDKTERESATGLNLWEMHRSCVVRSKDEVEWACLVSANKFGTIGFKAVKGRRYLTLEDWKSTAITEYNEDGLKLLLGNDAYDKYLTKELDIVKADFDKLQQAEKGGDLNTDAPYALLIQSLTEYGMGTIPHGKFGRWTLPRLASLSP